MYDWERIVYFNLDEKRKNLTDLFRCGYAFGRHFHAKQFTGMQGNQSWS